MPFDFKKEYKEFYLPKAKPEIVTVPRANYIAVRGQGDPNEENGAYQRAIGVLYAVAYSLKMSKRAGHEIDGFFDYVVPPLEGFGEIMRTSDDSVFVYNNRPYGNFSPFISGLRFDERLLHIVSVAIFRCGVIPFFHEGVKSVF